MLIHKRPVIPPAILLEQQLQAGEQILAGSVVDDVTVVTTGQEVRDYDFTSDDNHFNHTWED